MTILILTRPDDLTADRIVHQLNLRGAPVVRMDLAEFPTTSCLTASIGEDAGWSGRLGTLHGELVVEQIRAVYYRRPAPFRFPAALSDTERVWCEGEARHGLGGVLAALPHARWINAVDRSAAAERKPVQLATAARCGLVIPDTLVTNDPEQARAFVSRQPHGAVYKSFCGGPACENGQPVALYTTPVTAHGITDAVAVTTHLFQARIPKLADVRVTSVGPRMFAARIDSSSSPAAADFRADYDNLDYRVVEIPSSVQAGLRALTAALGLVYAAHDFVIDRYTGRWYFLETNPSGQFGWISCVADDIAAALAGQLIGDCGCA